MSNVASPLSFVPSLVGILVFLFMFNPYNIANLCFFFIVLYVVYRIFQAPDLLVDVQLLLLILFSLVYSGVSFSYDYILLNHAIKLILYFPVFYLLGKVVAHNSSDGTIKYFCYMAVLGLALFGILTAFLGARDGLRIVERPFLEDSPALVATGVGTYLAPGIALIGLLFAKSSLRLWLFNMAVAGTSLYGTISLGNRTGVILAVICLAVVVALQILFSRSLRQGPILIKFLAAFFFIQILFFVWLIHPGILGMADQTQFSLLAQRFSTLDLGSDPRLTSWHDALEGTFTNVTGGKVPALLFGYAHNLWLDVGWSTGVLPFLLLIAFTVLTIINCLALLSSRNSSYIKLLLTACLTGILLDCFVEPIIEANYFLFIAFCILAGMINRLKTGNLPCGQ